MIGTTDKLMAYFKFKWNSVEFYGNVTQDATKGILFLWAALLSIKYFPTRKFAMAVMLFILSLDVIRTKFGC